MRALKFSFQASLLKIQVIQLDRQYAVVITKRPVTIQIKMLKRHEWGTKVISSM